MKLGVELYYHCDTPTCYGPSLKGVPSVVLRFAFLPYLAENYGQALAHANRHYPAGLNQRGKAPIRFSIISERRAYVLAGVMYRHFTGKDYHVARPILEAMEQRAIRDQIRYAERKSYQQRGIVAPVRRGMHFDFPEENHATT